MTIVIVAVALAAWDLRMAQRSITDALPAPKRVRCEDCGGVS